MTRVAAQPPVLQDGWPYDAPYALTHPEIADIDGDGEMEVVVNQYTGAVHALDAAGVELPTWPFLAGPIAWGPSPWPPAIGDITGDGNLETVLVSFNFLYAIDSNGDSLPGWPLELPWGLVYGKPAIADVDGDGVGEVLVLDTQGAMTNRVQIYNVDGTSVPGWPVSLPHDAHFDPEVGEVGAGSIGDIAVGDLDFDGSPEIVVSTIHWASGSWQPRWLYALDAQGEMLPGWPVMPEMGFFDVGIADVDGDGSCEIFGGGGGVFAIYRADGTPFMPTLYGSQIRPIACGDLDGDGWLELVLPGAYGIEIYIPRWDDSTHWIAEDGFEPFDGVVVADVDGDGFCEIAARSAIEDGTSRVHLFDHELQELDGWPLITQVYSWLNTTTLRDLDGDGDLELCYRDDGVYMWDLPNTTGNPPRVEWGSYHHDPARTNNYHAGEPPRAQFVRGDADGDGDLDLADAIVLLEVLDTLSDSDCAAALDFNGDDAVDLGDAVEELTYCFLGGPPPTRNPFPDCGAAPTVDADCTRMACP